MKIPRYLQLVAMLLVVAQSGLADENPAPARPNVLFIVIDDLRDWVASTARWTTKAECLAKE